jgi:hypothetical protein
VLVITGASPAPVGGSVVGFGSGSVGSEVGCVVVISAERKK